MFNNYKGTTLYKVLSPTSDCNLCAVSSAGKQPKIGTKNYEGKKDCISTSAQEYKQWYTVRASSLRCRWALTRRSPILSPD